MVRLACRPAVANQLEENKVYRHEIVCAESVNEVEAAGSMDNLDGPIRSRFRGLSWDKKHQGWRVRIYYAGKQRHVGRFEDDVTAAKAYDKAAVYLYGANAITNFGLQAVEADPTEVSGFIILAKEQVDQEQQGRGQQRLIADSLQGSTGLPVQPTALYHDGLQTASIHSLLQAAQMSPQQTQNIIPVGALQQRQQIQGSVSAVGTTYDLQHLQQQQLQHQQMQQQQQAWQQLGLQQTLQSQPQQLMMMANPMALADGASSASCLTNMTGMTSGSSNTLNSSGYVICSSPGLQRAVSIPSHAYIDIPALVPALQQQQQQQQLMFFSNSSQPLQLQLQQQVPSAAAQMAAGASASSIQQQLLQQQLANLALPMSLPLNTTPADNNNLQMAALGGQWVAASADQGLMANSMQMLTSHVADMGTACASMDLGDMLACLPAQPTSSAAEQVTFVPLPPQQQQQAGLLFSAAGGSYGPEYNSNTSSGSSPLVLSSSARVPLTAVNAAAAVASPHMLLACEANRSLSLLTSTSTSIQLEGSPTHSSDGSSSSKTFGLKAHAMG